MFEKIKAKLTRTIIHQYEFVPPFEFEGATKDEVTKYLKSLSRPQLMHFADLTDVDEINTDLDLWDIFYTVKNLHTWPTDSEVSDSLSKLDWGKDSLYKKYKAGDLDFEKRLAGIQTKVDRIVTLLETAEFKLTGKEALKL